MNSWRSYKAYRSYNKFGANNIANQMSKINDNLCIEREVMALNKTGNILHVQM
jgi:hypothetical protein